MKRRFLTSDSLPPGPGYSHGVTVSGGHTTWTAGQVPLDARGDVVGVGDMRAQTRQVFENLQAVLGEAGATFADVVKFTYFVTDISELEAVRAVRDEFVDPARLPASTLVQVAALFSPDVMIEVEAIVVVD